MKQSIYLLLILSLASCNQREVDINQLVERNKIFYEVNSDKPFEGIARSYYANKQIKEEINFENGLRNGDYVEYQENGQKLTEGEYSENLKDGDWIGYHENGQKKDEGIFSKNLANGVVKTYHDNGQVYFECNFISGKKNGKQIIKNENGQPREEVEYKDDLRNGKGKYYKEGELTSEYNFLNNSYDGICIDYYSKNKLKSKYTYKDGKKLGAFEVYYDNGKLCVSGIMDSFEMYKILSFYTYEGKKFAKNLSDMDKFLVGTWLSPIPLDLQQIGYSRSGKWKGGYYLESGPSRKYTAISEGIQFMDDHSYQKFYKVRFEDGEVAYTSDAAGHFYIGVDENNVFNLPQLFISLNDVKYYFKDIQSNIFIDQEKKWSKTSLNVVNK